MKNYTTKSRVEKLDISVDGSPVYVRGLSSGDKLSLAEMQGMFLSMASDTQGKTPEEIGREATKHMTGEQYRNFVEYCNTYVFLRWCDKNGKRKYTDRDEFNELDSELVDAIYREASMKDADEGPEEAEKNS